MWDHASDAAKRESCYEAIALLARAGATLDQQQWHDPNEDGWGMLEKFRSDVRMVAALRGDIFR